MKNMLFILTGKKNCDIFRRNAVDLFDQIKDQILIKEFASARELKRFRENIAEELADEGEFMLLTEKQVEYVMENAPSNREYVKQNIHSKRRQ